MKKGIISFAITIGGLALGFVAYLLYVHVISFFAYPVAIVYVIFMVLILGGAFIALLANLKDFVVSIFKENNEVDHKGFKKHF